MAQAIYHHHFDCGHKLLWLISPWTFLFVDDCPLQKGSNPSWVVVGLSDYLEIEISSYPAKISLNEDYIYIYIYNLMKRIKLRK